jgi:hypothetical protein
LSEAVTEVILRLTKSEAEALAELTTFQFLDKGRDAIAPAEVAGKVWNYTRREAETAFAIRNILREVGI